MDELVEKTKQWQLWKKRLDYAKNMERELRMMICSALLKDKKKGAVKKEIGGKIYTATAKINTSLDANILKEIWRELSPVEKNSIKMKPTLNLRKYKELEAESILHKAVIEKPGMPTISVKEI